MAYIERKRIILGRWEDVTGNRERDGLICALRSIEAREGERLGWDQPARVWTLHLADLDTNAVEVRPVSSRAWRTGLDNPADDLRTTALSLPAPDRDLPALAYADARDGIAAVVAMNEGWMVAEEDLTDEDRAAQLRGVRSLVNNRKRVEVRTVTAVDINGYGYGLTRMRGKPLEDTVRLVDRDDMWATSGVGPGNLVRSLYCLATAARLGTWPRT
jgi:hypothetical protein